MSGTMLAGLLAAVLNGPEAESQRYVVQIDHTSVCYVEGEPEPDAHLCRVEIVSSADGSFDARTQFGRETAELSGVIAVTEDGRLRGEVQFAYLVEQGEESPPDTQGVRTRVELIPGESMMIGGFESRGTETVEGVALTRVSRDSVTLTVRPTSEARNRRRIDASLP